MRIRSRLLGLVFLVSAAFLLIGGISVRTWTRLSAMRGAINEGVLLVAQSRQAHGLMKDLIFDLFSPRVYSSIQGLVLAPRSMAARTEWVRAVEDFRKSYADFMANPELRGLLGDEELKEAFIVAGPMSERAFAEFEGLRGVLERIREKYPEREELYSLIQSSKDDSLIEVFDRVRSASFYLGNIFESYLNRFVSGLEREARRIEQRVMLTYLLAALLVTAFAALGVMLMTRSILANLRLVEGGMERLAEGDFSARISPLGKDEIGLLAEQVNLFAGRLKRNVDSLAALLGEVNLALPEDPDLDRILRIVTDLVLADGAAEAAAVYLAEGGGRFAWSGFPAFVPPPGEGALEDAGASPPGAMPLPAWSFGGAAGDGGLVGACARADRPFIVHDARAEAWDPASRGLDPGIRSLVLVPLDVRRRVSGVCLFARKDRPFTDLEVAQLASFTDYAALVVDNALASAALAARRDAEYRALQAQLQPHFIYNVLNGLVALNRMGERRPLELSLHALRDMLRYTVEHERWSTVGEEFTFLERYCALQKLRFEDRLLAEIAHPAELDRLLVPKLIVQPLVENAVIHSVEPLSRPVRIGVSARSEGGDLVLRVEDDGAGADPGAIAPAARVGIGNLRERLALLYHGASLGLEGGPGRGFSAEIRIPLAELATR